MNSTANGTGKTRIRLKPVPLTAATIMWTMWCSAKWMHRSRNAPKGIDADLWQQARDAHEGFQAGTAVLLVLPYIATQTGFFDLRVNSDLSIHIPDPLLEPDHQAEMAKVLVPPPMAKSDEILAASGGMFYPRESPGAPEFVKEGQHFDEGEAKEMPVRFIVDRDLPAGVDRLTLSYSFVCGARVVVVLEALNFCWSLRSRSRRFRAVSMPWRAAAMAGRSLVMVSIMWTGTRMVRLWSAMAPARYASGLPWR